MKRLSIFFIILLILLITACQSEPTPPTVVPPTAEPTLVPVTETAVSSPIPPTNEPYPAQSHEAYPALAAQEPHETIPVYSYEVINSYPHDPAAFTQGLIYLDNVLYEGTGRYGQSSLRQVDLESGSVLQTESIPQEYFGEGITIFDDKIYQLTWQNQIGFVYDQESFELLESFTYPTEGWGLTHDGEQLIMSDGTNNLYFLDPDTLEINNQIPVYDDQGNPVIRLNELEYIDGDIYANIWQTNLIAIIDPETGQVTAWIDLNNLLDPATVTQAVDVLNGIAYDAENGRLFVTGKLWPRLFEIKLVETAVAHP